MKDKFYDMIMRLFGVEPYFVGNYDDLNEGYEFNPDPRVMLQIKYTSHHDEAGAYVMIDKYTMRIHAKELEHDKIYSGQLILLETGDPDYDFYAKILKNWRAF